MFLRAVRPRGVCGVKALGGGCPPPKAPRVYYWNSERIA